MSTTSSFVEIISIRTWVVFSRLLDGVFTRSLIVELFAFFQCFDLSSLTRSIYCILSWRTAHSLTNSVSIRAFCALFICNLNTIINSDKVHALTLNLIKWNTSFHWNEFLFAARSSIPIKLICTCHTILAVWLHGYTIGNHRLGKTSLSYFIKVKSGQANKTNFVIFSNCTISNIISYTVSSNIFISSCAFIAWNSGVSLKTIGNISNWFA